MNRISRGRRKRPLDQSLRRAWSEVRRGVKALDRLDIAERWFIGLSWTLGLGLVILGLRGDDAGWWTDRPFLLNVVSGLAVSAWGAPIAVLLLTRLTARREHRTRRTEAARSVASSVEQVVVAFAVSVQIDGQQLSRADFTRASFDQLLLAALDAARRGAEALSIGGGTYMEPPDDVYKGAALALVKVETASPAYEHPLQPMTALLNHQGPALTALDTTGRVTELLGQVGRAWKQIRSVWMGDGKPSIYQARSSMFLPRPESTFSLVAGGRTFYSGWSDLLALLAELRAVALELLDEDKW